MPKVSDIAARVRLELGDRARTFSVRAAGDGVTVRFELPESPVEPTGLSVSRSDGTTTTALASPTDYTLDALTGAVTLSSPLLAGHTLSVTGTAYTLFLEDEIATFVSSAVTKHTHNTNPPVALHDADGLLPMGAKALPEVEVHLVAILAKIEALWILATDASRDISVMTPEGMSIPRAQRFTMLMEMIDAEQARYKDLAKQLNVGMSRVEMGTLRRISRMTGRYVPVFIPQELDDPNPPTRVWPPIDPPAPTEPAPLWYDGEGDEILDGGTV